MPIPKLEPGRTPWTDLRALGSSAAFHALVLLLASLAALGVALPRESDEPRVLRAEVGPVDNRAPVGDAGGAPGELGGTNPPEAVALAADGRLREGQAPIDPSADALLSDVLPAPTRPEPSERALPGPSTSGIGLLNGPGTGGGGGSGGGSGGGIGRGIGPGTEFFGTTEHASSFAYVIDVSGSMINHDALRLAKRELLSSLEQLPPDARFGVVFYNLKPRVFLDPSGTPHLMAATSDNKERVRSHLSTIHPDGGTRPMPALHAALDLKPEVIFFLTDGQDLSREDVEAIQASAGSVRIQAVEFGDGPPLSSSDPLQELAHATGGSYRYLDLTTLARP